LSWFHNNDELKQSVKFMKRYAGDDYTFIINRAKLDDRGEYIIRAENTYGYREEVVFLNVQRTYDSRVLTDRTGTIPRNSVLDRDESVKLF